MCKHHSQQISPDVRDLLFFTTRHITTTHTLQATATTIAPPAIPTPISRSCIPPMDGLDVVGVEEGEVEEDGEGEEVGTGHLLRSKIELKQLSFEDSCGTSSGEISSRDERSG